jgi:putative addiction module component (TIGR02574 family)
MDIAATLDGITALSVEKRIRIVQAILESITVEQVYPELTMELKQELDRRSKPYDADPDDVMAWKEMLEDLLDSNKLRQAMLNSEGFITSEELLAARQI